VAAKKERRERKGKSFDRITDRQDERFQGLETVGAGGDRARSARLQNFQGLEKKRTANGREGTRIENVERASRSFSKHWKL
jgi:hypothetical protein